ncbi:MAG TPA: hypothetical protein VIX20_09550 [Ktedonobacteraceae bacterium]
MVVRVSVVAWACGSHKEEGTTAGNDPWVGRRQIVECVTIKALFALPNQRILQTRGPLAQASL